MNWELIKHNLTNSAMTEVDARNFSLRKLYEARNLSWCLGEAKRNSRTSKPKQDDTSQAYEEGKYLNILKKIKDEKILDDVSFDEDQADLISDRIKEGSLWVIAGVCYYV